MKHKEQIIKLYNEGKSRTEICKILGCTKSTVCYHLSNGQKEKSRNRRRNLKNRQTPLKLKMSSFLERKCDNPNRLINNSRRPLQNKIIKFCVNRKTGILETKPTFTYDELIAKIGENPVCYLTGTPIDLSKSTTYSLDHILPVSRGGDNSLSNLGLCDKRVNTAKSDLTVEEFRELCSKVVNYKL